MHIVHGDTQHNTVKQARTQGGFEVVRPNPPFAFREPELHAAQLKTDKHTNVLINNYEPRGPSNMEFHSNIAKF